MITNNTRDQIIKEVIFKKCSFYYKFEKIMKNVFIVNSSFIIKFIRFDSLKNEFSKFQFEIISFHEELELN